MIDPKLKNGIIIVVTAVWAINFVAGLVIESYEPDQAINAIFMGIVGGLFALGAKAEHGDKKTPPPSAGPNVETPRTEEPR